MDNSEKPADLRTEKTHWLIILLCVLMGTAMVLWLLSDAWQGYNLGLPVLGYPWLVNAMFTLPYGLILMALAALLLSGIAKIVSPGLMKISFWKFIGVLFLAGALLLLVWLGVAWRIVFAPLLIVIVGGLYLYFRPPLKILVIWLVFVALFGFFLHTGILYLNACLDASSPVVLRGKVVELLECRYLVVQPDSGGAKLTIDTESQQKNSESFDRMVRHYYDRFHRRIDGYRSCDFLPQALGGNDQPLQGGRVGIEVYGVHRGLFGLKWQEKGAGYQLLLPEVYPPR